MDTGESAEAINVIYTLNINQNEEDLFSADI
jgi:hypothetical protein